MNIPINSNESTRTVEAKARWGGKPGKMVTINALREAPSGVESIALDQHGVDTLVDQLTTSDYVDTGGHTPSYLANGRLWSDDDLRYRASASIKAVLIRKAATEAEAKAAAIKLADANTQAILDARPAPGAYRLSAYGREVSGHVVVTEDRRVMVQQMPHTGTPHLRDMTDVADGTDGWTFASVPLTSSLVTMAAGVVDNLNDWLKLATK